MRILHQAAIGQIAVEFDERVDGIAAKILGERDAAICRGRIRVFTSHGAGGIIASTDKSACGCLMAARQVATGVAQRLVTDGSSSELVYGAIAQRVSPSCQAC